MHIISYQRKLLSRKYIWHMEVEISYTIKIIQSVMSFTLIMLKKIESFFASTQCHLRKLEGDSWLLDCCISARIHDIRRATIETSCFCLTHFLPSYAPLSASLFPHTIHTPFLSQRLPLASFKTPFFQSICRITILSNLSPHHHCHCYDPSHRHIHS